MKKMILTLVLVASAGAQAYEQHRDIDSLDLACTYQGQGLNEEIEIHGLVVQGVTSGRFGASLTVSPGVYDKNYNPGGSRALLGFLVKHLGQPSYAFTLDNTAPKDSEMNSDHKFPTTFHFQRLEESWTNDTTAPDADFEYEIGGIHSPQPALTIVVSLANSPMRFKFEGTCRQLTH